MKKTNENNIKKYIIPKPWGYEYLIFENKYLGIWFLHLNNNSSTSLHCHPDKKTGLIVIDGNAKISFLNNNISLTPLSKVMIWSGVFHSTKTTSNPLELLEVETPKNKYNLVRMEDSYGRRGKKYEEKSSWIKRDNNHLWIQNKINFSIIYKDKIKISIKYLDSKLINTFKDDDLIVILSPNAITSDNNTYTICKVGDVINIKTLNRLMKEFVTNKKAKVMCIEKL